jgi:fluoroquinolone transport system permease protein
MYTILKTDIRNILRDPSLLIICVVPFIMLALLRWGYPPLAELWPEGVKYKELGLAMFCITGAVMPGIAIAFAILDEKDNHLDTVLRILPVSYQTITIYRMLMVFLFAFFSAILLLVFSNISHFTLLENLLLALLIAFLAPVLASVPAFYARNKIEGATMTKLLNFLLILPLPAFLFPGVWSWFLMVIPSWWIYFAFESVGSPGKFIAAMAGGLILLSVFMIFFNMKVWGRR